MPDLLDLDTTGTLTPFVKFEDYDTDIFNPHCYSQRFDASNFQFPCSSVPN